MRRKILRDFWCSTAGGSASLLVVFACGINGLAVLPVIAVGTVGGTVLGRRLS